MKEQNLGMNMNFITATSTAAGNLDMGSDDDVGREEIAESRFMTTSATFYSTPNFRQVFSGTED